MSGEIEPIDGTEKSTGPTVHIWLLDIPSTPTLPLLTVYTEVLLYTFV